jgi:tyrosyl-tRNA synthetase
MTSPVTDTERRADLIERGLAEMLGSRDELIAALDSGLPMRHYIGFEISGRVHLGYLVVAAKIRDFMEAGLQCHVFLADWHTWINDKLGGDRDRIRRVATGYFAEALRAAVTCVGGDPKDLNFVLATELYEGHPEYWAGVIDVAKHTSLARMQRSITIMGRGEGEQVDFAKLLYPAMQAADIFQLGIHVAHAGLDQRKAHVIARDVALQMRINPLLDAQQKPMKPFAVHHPLLLGLRKPPTWPVTEDQRRDVFSAMKMSKSDPNAAVFIHDSEDDIRRKLRKAFCPPDDVELNPVIDWIDKLCFGLGDTELVVDRAPENGGAVTFASAGAVRDAYLAGSLHPTDAKNALADRLIARLEPARQHFDDPDRRAALAELDG